MLLLGELYVKSYGVKPNNCNGFINVVQGYVLDYIGIE